MTLKEYFEKGINLGWKFRIYYRQTTYGDWTCVGIKLIFLLIHYHIGYGKDTDPSYPRYRLRNISILGWTIPFLKYYTH